MLSETSLVIECKQLNRAAQKELFDRFAPKMRAVALRYAGNSEDAKDIIQEGFVKVFSKISQFSASGSLEGWIKRIIINTAIDHYRKKNKWTFLSPVTAEISDEIADFNQGKEYIDKSDLKESYSFDLVSNAGFTKEELLAMINQLPEHFRLAFNLYFVEAYSHKEISELLNIDETTSRTRVARAKKILQKKLYELTIDKICK